jgi:hypothetical protein
LGGTQNMNQSILNNQIEICSKYQAAHYPAPAEMKLGISRAVKNGSYPIHGLRHPPEADTCGWYIYTGEFSDDPNFFQPLHVMHLNERCSEILPYLGLPPGWRFLLAQNYIDVWFDESLLKI